MSSSIASPAENLPNLNGIKLDISPNTTSYFLSSEINDYTTFNKGNEEQNELLVEESKTIQTRDDNTQIFLNNIPSISFEIVSSESLTTETSNYSLSENFDKSISLSKNLILKETNPQLPLNMLVKLEKDTDEGFEIMWL